MESYSLYGGKLQWKLETFSSSDLQHTCVIQSSKENESMSLANPMLKASSSFSHISIFGEVEADGNKDYNDDGNTKVQENQKVGTDLLDQIGRSRDIVGAFNEAIPHVEASACDDTQSPRVDGTIKAVEGSQKEVFYREANNTI
ncbi:hypothetical protein Ancab_018424 [Ancistrocladus abbreviatus]